MTIKKPLSVGGLKMYGVSASSSAALALWMGRKRLSGQVTPLPSSANIGYITLTLTEMRVKVGVWSGKLTADDGFGLFCRRRSRSVHTSPEGDPGLV